jgi:hypothetical protein
MVAMQDVRIQIDAVGPHDRARNGINGHQREEGRIIERRENATVEHTDEVELAYEAICKGDSQLEAAEVLDVGDPKWASHVISLPKAFNRIHGLTSSRVLPIDGQLLTVQQSPLLDEASRGARQRSGEQRAVVDPHQRLVTGVDGMEMCRLVVVPLHVDDDPVELAQPRHERGVRPGRDAARRPTRCYGAAVRRSARNRASKAVAIASSSSGRSDRA